MNEDVEQVWSDWWWYTTIENPSYFFMTLNCAEAMKSFSSHFNQYSLVDQYWGNIPSEFWQGGAIDLESYDAELDTTVTRRQRGRKR